MMSLQQAVQKLEFDRVLARVIHYASSEPGRELLSSLDISTSLASIRAELTAVSEAKRLLEEEGELPLAGIHPIAPVVQRATVEGSVLVPRELLHVASTLQATRVLKAFVVKRKDKYPLLASQVDRLTADKVLEYNIAQAIDETGTVRSSASRELQSIRRGIGEKYEQLRKRLEGILRSVSELGFSQEDIITTREGRMVIPVKAEHKNRVPGFIQSASASGATVFIEPTETLELNNDIRNLQFQEQREVDRILRELTRQVAAISTSLKTNLAVLAEVDSLNARAKYSIEVLGVEPHVSEHGAVKLFAARHPILLMKHGMKETVPLDVEVGDTFKTLIISGPNAGGKSVALKTVGLLSLMVQSGLHIPASDQSTVRVFRNIFVDIGDEQSIENDLSTFSSHLANLKDILETADENSLVLIDEIGSGTDPSEGGALAAAVLEQLTSRNALTISTTHHGALKVFAHETEGVENAAMEFDQDTLQPTYRLRIGVPGSSYALEMAARLGIHEGILLRSRDILGVQHTRLDKLISELESSVQQHRKDISSLQTEKAHLRELIGEYETKSASQSAELRELKRKAVVEAREIVERANALIEGAVREIREQRANTSTIKAVRKVVENKKAALAEEEKGLVQPVPIAVQGSILPGSYVRLAGGTETGEVQEVSTDGRTAVIVFGAVKMKVSLADLSLADASSVKASRPSHPDVLQQKEIQRELDLRGMTGGEALPLVDKFLDDALLTGLHRIDIIHGKGTGALRKKVTEFLSQHPRVKSFHLAEWNEGGSGATVVELLDR